MAVGRLKRDISSPLCCIEFIALGKGETKDESARYRDHNPNPLQIFSPVVPQKNAFHWVEIFVLDIIEIIPLVYPANSEERRLVGILNEKFS